ncbi:membrane protein [Streptomyces kurssanovii]|nr:membrane protein [Streptomyces kurssanovii]
MSDQSENTTANGGGPEPEPIRFFGTTWVGHDGRYGLRRAGVAAGSLITAFAAALLLRLAYQGLAIAEVGSFVNVLVVVMFAVCSAIAFRKTWEGFSRRPDGSPAEDSLRSLKAIGFIGSLIAYALRCLSEAPGEKLRRAEYESALRQYEQRRGTRSGNPAARGTKGRTKRR